MVYIYIGKSNKRKSIDDSDNSKVDKSKSNKSKKVKSDHVEKKKKIKKEKKKSKKSSSSESDSDSGSESRAMIKKEKEDEVKPASSSAVIIKPDQSSKQNEKKKQDVVVLRTYEGKLLGQFQDRLTLREILPTDITKVFNANPNVHYLFLEVFRHMSSAMLYGPPIGSDINEIKNIEKDEKNKTVVKIKKLQHFLKDKMVHIFNIRQETQDESLKTWVLAKCKEIQEEKGRCIQVHRTLKKSTQLHCVVWVDMNMNMNTKATSPSQKSGKSEVKSSKSEVKSDKSGKTGGGGKSIKLKLKKQMEEKEEKQKEKQKEQEKKMRGKLRLWYVYQVEDKDDKIKFFDIEMTDFKQQIEKQELKDKKKYKHKCDSCEYHQSIQEHFKSMDKLKEEKEKEKKEKKKLKKTKEEAKREFENLKETTRLLEKELKEKADKEKQAQEDQVIYLKALELEQASKKKLQQSSLEDILSGVNA